MILFCLYCTVVCGYGRILLFCLQFSMTACLFPNPNREKCFINRMRFFRAALLRRIIMDTRGTVMNEQKIKDMITAGRNFVRPQEGPEDWQSDQELKKPQPPLVKAPVSDRRIHLPMNFEELKIDNDFLHVINTRCSKRIYTDEEISLLELSYLLWCTQGIKSIRGKAYATLRTVPCGGARHEFECYMAIRRVTGLEPGYYHYLPMTHEIELLKKEDDETLKSFISDSLQGQSWACKASAVFYYSFVCYRAEWRYGIHAHRVVLIDAGHITENLYLAGTSIGLGSCAIGAVNGKISNRAFDLDGEEEFIFYAHPVGTFSPDDKQKEDDIYAFVKEQGL